jgi:hypothetical protein
MPRVKRSDIIELDMYIIHRGEAIVKINLGRIFGV